MGNNNVLPNMRATPEILIYNNVPSNNGANFISLSWLQARVYA